MSNFQDIETAVVTRMGVITQAKPAVTIVPMPEVEADFKIPTGNAARITVACNGAESDDLKATDLVIQDKIQTIVVVIQSPKLRGNIGIYTLEEAILLCIIGFKPPSCRSPIRFQSGQLYQPGEKVNDIWTYQMEFRTTGLISQQEVPEEDLYNLITQITINPNIGDPTVTVDDEIDGGEPDSTFDDEYDGGEP